MFYEKNIYIISSQLLLSDLLAAQIKNHLGCTCFTANQFEELSPVLHSESSEGSLYLIDCFGFEQVNLEQKILSVTSALPGQDRIALFNIGSKVHIERYGITLGVRGFFYATDHLETILRGTRLILEGEYWASRKSITECLEALPPAKHSEPKPTSSLTRREMEILSLLATGKGNDSIAKSLYISSNTVRTHLHHIFKKLKVENRLQAAQWASHNLQ